MDDNIFNIKALEGILKLTLKKSYNFIIHSCINGEEAIKKILETEKKKKIYDIVFMDINMPVNYVFLIIIYVYI